MAPLVAFGCLGPWAVAPALAEEAAAPAAGAPADAAAAHTNAKSDASGSAAPEVSEPKKAKGEKDEKDDAEEKGEKKAEGGKAPVKRWYDRIELSALVDGYASINYNFPTPSSPTTIGSSVAARAIGHKNPTPSAPGTVVGGNQFRAFDQSNGFALSWVGVDVAYPTGPTDPIGGVVTLRFGPSAGLLAPLSEAAADLANVRQAFATWKPWEAIAVDFGKFDSPYGVERMDTPGNMNYTRSAVFWYIQPATHTGLRLTYEFSPKFSLMAMAVNGWDVTLDDNTGKSFGGQAVYKPIENTTLAVGYLGGPEQSDQVGTSLDRATVNSRLRHYVDMNIDSMLTEDWRVIFNFDFVTEEMPPENVNRNARWYGATLATSYNLTKNFFASLRGTYMRDELGYALGTGVDTRYAEGTFTLGYAPNPHLILMLDNRIDWTPDRALFQKGATGTIGTQATTTLGVCMTTSAME